MHRSEAMQTLDIDIISDVVCPWCYLGQKRLALALESVSGEIAANITWKPYQLEPNAPPEGFDVMDYLARKIGGEERVRQSHQMLTQMGAEIGLPFAFEKTKTFPNTLDAHRLLLWAGQIDAETQDKVAQSRRRCASSVFGNLFVFSKAKGRPISAPIWVSIWCDWRTRSSPPILRAR